MLAYDLLLRGFARNSHIYPMILEAMKRPKRRDVAVHQIRSLIAGGELRPGQRLPSERELATRLAISRASVREAIRSLEISGLVEIIPGKGTFVRELSESVIVDPISSSLLSSKGLMELLEVRRVLEPQIAALAAQRAQPIHIQEMQAALQEVERRLERNRYDEAVKPIIAFHRAVTKATGNHLMERLINAIAGLLSESMRTTLRIPGRPARSLEGHRQILAAIKAGDAAAAQEAMMRHLSGLEEAILSTGQPK